MLHACVTVAASWPNPAASLTKLNSRTHAARGHQLSFQVASSPDVAVYKYGVPLYDNLLLFAPTTEQIAGGLDAAGVSAFVEQVRARKGCCVHCFFDGWRCLLELGHE